MTVITDDPDAANDLDGASTTDEPARKASVGSARRFRLSVRGVAMRQRRVIVKVHRWLSLALLAWLAVISATGAWLVVHDAVESWIHPERYTVTPGDVGLQAATDSARTAAGEGAVVTGALTQRNSRGVYKVTVTVPIELDEPMAVEEEPPTEERVYFVDPGTSDVNGMTSENEGVTQWLYRGHVDLWQDTGVFAVFDAESGWCRANAGGSEPGGVRGVVCDVIPNGDDMVAWFAVGWIVVLGTGFHLWYWPGVRRWATAFVIKRRRGAFALNMSVHKVVGLVVWTPLVIIAFTGTAFAFPNLSGWFENITPAQRDFDLWTAPDVTSGAANGRTPLSMDDIVDRVATQHPERAVDSIYPPTDETGTYSAWVTRGYTPWTREDGGGNVFMVFDQYSGETLYDGTPGEGNVFDQAWDDYSFPLHTGDFAGTPTRVLWVAVGLSPMLLGATGVTMHLIRRRKRRRVDIAAQLSFVIGVRAVLGEALALAHGDQGMRTACANPPVARSGGLGTIASSGPTRP